jgi:hypothetical protein
MMLHLLFPIVFYLVTSAQLPEQQPADSKTYSFTLTNPSGFRRDDELIRLSRKDLQTITGARISSGQYLQLRAKTPVAVQHDDLDGDKTWDEAVFLFSFAPYQTIRLTLELSHQPAAIKIAPRSAMHLYKRDSTGAFGNALLQEVMPYNLPANDFSKTPVPLYHVEGPTWENDKVAFRSYFDVRNAKDIFGKTTPLMVMDNVGRTSDNYHALDSSWGMDILKVGTSLGAGAIGMLVSIDGKDSLVRLGGPEVALTEFSQVATGPLRSVLRIRYKDWNVNGQLFDVTEEISIWGGQYFYENRLTVSQKAKLVTGIVNLNSKEPFRLQDQGCSVLYTHDRQSENADFLGMAVMAREEDFLGFGETPRQGPGITNTYTFIFREKTPVTYRFFSSWEKTAGSFASRVFFENMLRQEAAKWTHPIRMKWIR